MAIHHKPGILNDEKHLTTVDPKDLVSILTTDEAKAFLQSADLKAAPTAYAKGMFTEWTHMMSSWCYDTSVRETVWWWLRSLFPEKSFSAPSMSDDGRIRNFVYSNDYIYDQVTFVRPVIRIYI